MFCNKKTRPGQSENVCPFKQPFCVDIYFTFKIKFPTPLKIQFLVREKGSCENELAKLIRCESRVRLGRKVWRTGGQPFLTSWHQNFRCASISRTYSGRSVRRWMGRSFKLSASVTFSPHGFPPTVYP